MLSLNQVIAGAKVRGVAGASPVEIVRTEWIGPDALSVVYRGADGPAEVSRPLFARLASLGDRLGLAELSGIE